MATTPVYGEDLPTNNADFDAWGTKNNDLHLAWDGALGSPTNTIKGRNTGGTGPHQNLTPAQVNLMLPAVIGDAGTGGTKGLVPPPAAGDGAAGKVLLATGGWGYAGARAIGRFVGGTGATVSARGISVVRNNVGLYSVTLNPAMPDAGYIPQISIETAFLVAGLPAIYAKSASGFTLDTRRNNPGGSSSDAYDPDFIGITIQAV